MPLDQKVPYDILQKKGTKMGDWGHGIFQNDLAQDVKTYTLKVLGDGLDGEEQTGVAFF